MIAKVADALIVGFAVMNIAMVSSIFIYIPLFTRSLKKIAPTHFKEKLNQHLFVGRDSLTLLFYLFKGEYRAIGDESICFHGRLLKYTFGYPLILWLPLALIIAALIDHK